MGACLDDVLRQPQVVVEGVEILVRRHHVAGVRHGHLGDGGVGLQNRVDGGAHLGDVVEGVEDAEDVDAGPRRFLDERVADLVRVRGVADGVAPAQEHLDVDVGHGLAQQIQAHPRVLVEKAHGHVEGRATPCLYRVEIRGEPGDVLRRGDQRGPAHAGGQQRLVGIAERGVRQREGALVTHALRELLRAQVQQEIPGAARQVRAAVRALRQLVKGPDVGRALAVRPVDRHFREVVEDAAGLIVSRRRAQQVRVVGNETGIDPPRREVRFAQQHSEEADVRSHAGDVEFVERPDGAGDRLLEVLAAAGHFDQQRVEVRGNFRADERGAIEAHARTARRAVGGQGPRVGAEAVIRILGGDAALQGRAGHRDVVLDQAQLSQ